ncbi:flagellar hook-length control protein FliK [Aestuariivirga sp.]|uniref:flagellar hook-length control protein FliK n=1 Tax=Aestuariivirga sp. TaxID=2650926 RepID=UPI0039E3312C
MFSLKAGNFAVSAVAHGRGKASARKAMNGGEGEASGAVTAAQSFLNFLSVTPKPDGKVQEDFHPVATAPELPDAAHTRQPNLPAPQRPVPMKDIRSHDNPRSGVSVAKHSFPEQPGTLGLLASRQDPRDATVESPEVRMKPMVTVIPDTVATPAVPQPAQPMRSAAEQVADAVRAAAPVADATPHETHIRKLEIALRPQHLGPVHVTLRIKGDTLDVQVVTQSQEAADVLMHDRAMLVMLLGRSGDQQAISVTVMAQPQPDQAFSMAGGGQGAFTNHRPAQGGNTEHHYEKRQDDRGPVADDGGRGGIYL